MRVKHTSKHTHNILWWV